MMSRTRSSYAVTLFAAACVITVILATARGGNVPLPDDSDLTTIPLSVRAPYRVDGISTNALSGERPTSGTAVKR